MKYLFMGLIRLYQWTISPLLGPRCKYWPSCSRYGYEAFARHGTVRGMALTGWRIVRCNPWSHGGIDPVPAERRRGGSHYVRRDDDRGHPAGEERAREAEAAPPARPARRAGRFGRYTTGSTTTPGAPSALAEVARPQGATE